MPKGTMQFEDQLRQDLAFERTPYLNGIVLRYSVFPAIELSIRLAIYLLFPKIALGRHLLHLISLIYLSSEYVFQVLRDAWRRLPSKGL